MPTSPPASLFDQASSKTQVEAEIALALPVLEEIRNYGLNALIRCSHDLHSSEHHLAILMPYKHILEMLDAISVLIADVTSGPASLQLRSAFEALLTVEYIIKADTQRRAFAYLVGNVHSELTTLRALQCLQDTGVPPEHIRENIENLEARLGRPAWAEADTEFRSLKKARNGRNPPWYHLWHGPKNLELLADDLGRSKDYNILYRQWSGTAHVGDINDHLKAGGPGLLLIRRLRHTMDFSTTILFSVVFGLKATERVLCFYRPAERTGYARWYNAEIRSRWLKLREVREMKRETL